MEYKIVSSDYPDFLSGEVSALLNSGWALHGSLVVFNKTPASLKPDLEYVQAMVKYDAQQDFKDWRIEWGRR